MSFRKTSDTSYTDYDKFAWLFDEQWGDFGVQVFPVLSKMAGDRIPARGKILDLCCGTGQLARVLIKNGYQVTGLDASVEMLRFARINAPETHFILADARNFQLPPVFDAVLSTYDSLNHLMSLKDLKAAFRNVYRCLIPGGVFLFDLNTLKAYQKEWEGYLDFVEKPDYLYMNRAHYNSKTHLGHTHCTVFRRNGDSWQRSDIRLYQKYQPISRVDSLLQKVGFIRIHKYALNRKRGYRPFRKTDSRVFFVCQKPSHE